MVHLKRLSVTTMLSIAKIISLAWRMRRAWWFTATARTKARFARTTLGSFWLGLSNMLSIAVLAIVYGTVFKVDDFRGYVVYLGLGLVIWNTIASSISASASLFEANARNLLNSNIHPIFYTLEEWSFQLQTFAQSFGLVVLALSFIQHTLLLNMLKAAFLPMLNLVIFIYWMPLVVFMIGARFRDLFQLVPILLQLIFLLSPILYKKESLGDLAWVAEFNPIYRVLSLLRSALLSGSVQLGQNLGFLAINIAGMMIGVILLEKQRKHLPFLL